MNVGLKSSIVALPISIEEFTKTTDVGIIDHSTDKKEEDPTECKEPIVLKEIESDHKDKMTVKNQESQEAMHLVAESQELHANHQ